LTLPALLFSLTTRFAPLFIAHLFALTAAFFSALLNIIAATRRTPGKY
jgi:hypothetical protein